MHLYMIVLLLRSFTSRIIFFNRKNVFGNVTLAVSPIQTGARLLRPAPTSKRYNFKTIKAITTKIGDFSKKSSRNILTLVSRDHKL